MPANRAPGTRADALVPAPSRHRRPVAALLLASLMLASMAGCAGEGNDLNDGKAFATPDNAQFAAAVRDGHDRLARELVAAGANPDAAAAKATGKASWRARGGHD